MKAYAHQLRHACSYYLANKGCDLRLIQDYLGRKLRDSGLRGGVKELAANLSMVLSD